jgi:putative endonuclease
MANVGRTLYVEVTNNLVRRVFEHKQALLPGFTSEYGLTDLVYYEATADVRDALAREKQVKGWLREKKVALIEAMNPEWEDLSHVIGLDVGSVAFERQGVTKPVTRSERRPTTRRSLADGADPSLRSG